MAMPLYPRHHHSNHYNMFSQRKYNKPNIADIRVIKKPYLVHLALLLCNALSCISSSLFLSRRIALYRPIRANIQSPLIFLQISHPFGSYPPHADGLLDVARLAKPLNDKLDIAVIHVCSNHAISEFYTRIITFDQLAKQKDCSNLGIINI